MYRAPRAAHLLTHYRHCQEGTMRGREGGEREGAFSSSRRSKTLCTWKLHAVFNIFLLDFAFYP